METPETQAVGVLLAARHADAVEPDREVSLANYSERPRVGDWSMRAALTRYALPHAVRAANVITHVRRLDAALHPFIKPLERHSVMCDRALALHQLAAPAAEPYPDTRMADLARVAHHGTLDIAMVLSAYDAASASPLSDDEHAALPLLGVALQLDELAGLLTTWANHGPKDPPVGAVDDACERIQARLDALGVAVESPRPSGRGRRDRGGG